MSTAIQIQTAHSVTRIDPDAWNSLDPTTPYASYDWYRFGEIASNGDTPIYIVASHQDEPVARATFWLTRQEPLPITNKLIRGGLQAAFRQWPLMICRSPFANCPGLILPDTPLRDAALEAIAQTAWQMSREHRAFAVLFDYLQYASTEGLIWPDGFMTMDMPEAATYLPLIWPDFESYVRALGKSARKDYHRHCNRAADLGIEVRALPGVTVVDDALDLIRRVEAHHNTAPTPYARPILEHLEQVGGTWLAAEMEGRLVGCGVLLPDRGALTLALLGLDYTVQYAYFQLMYAAIRYAIESGAAVLRGGTGAYDFKQRLGFHIEQTSYITFFITNGGFRRAIKWV